MAQPISILWFRQDLRLDDNPALHAAMAHGSVVPVFIGDPEGEGDWPPGGASRVWLHHSLQKFDAALRGLGSRLIVRIGDSLASLLELIGETSATAVYWNRRSEPAIAMRDVEVATDLGKRGLATHSLLSQSLFEPGTVLTKSASPYKVFTPFSRACLEHPQPDQPLEPPRSIPRPDTWPASLELAQLGLLPKIPWDSGIVKSWEIGEAECTSKIAQFVKEPVGEYPETRNRPDWAGTSRLSPHLHFGEVSPRRLWHTVRAAMRNNDRAEFKQGAEGFLRQLLWREFAIHLLFHFPRTVEEPLNPTFAEFQWRTDPQGLLAWQRGQTGYPIVDAGMRQLWATGWMHNRVRMIVGSFLVKDLLVSWREGAAWFWDTLVDADLANNTLGWQWIAGCGADAAPFFRVFNPVGQGEKFDPDGAYVRRWVPELAKLPNERIQRPWEASPETLRDAGVRLGQNYPRPIVDHAEARARALDLFKNR